MLVTIGLAAILSGSAAQEPELETVLARASEYIQHYERTLGMVIAREEYIQRVPAGGSMSLPAAPGLAGNIRTPYRAEDQERRLLSDYMMIRLQSDEQWVGFRAILEVDGKPVRDRLERMQEVLTGSVEETIELWKKLSEESARYNIGNVTRTNNVPTLGLLVLRGDHQHRFELEHTGNERIEDLDVWEISFREHSSPALIQNLQGDDIFTYGRIWVDPADGRIVRTEVRTGDKNSELQTEITVRYQPHAGLDVWVPRDMKERYKVGDSRIDAEAKYSDYQQFKVSVDTTISK